MTHDSPQRSPAAQAQRGSPPATLNDSAAPADTKPRSRYQRIELPGEHLTIEETLRVMDVARELRDQRETAEVMFRQDDVRGRLREKLVNAARMAGDDVSGTEIEAAIDQYLGALHTYEDPPWGWRRFVAHCWIRRNQIMVAAAALAAVAGGWLYFLV